MTTVKIPAGTGVIPDSGLEVSWPDLEIEVVEQPDPADFTRVEVDADGVLGRPHG